MNLNFIIMKKIIISFLVLTFSSTLTGQAHKDLLDRDSIVSNNSEDYFNKISLTLGGGVFIPQGELTKYFKAAPILEFNLNFPIFQKKSIDLVGQIIIPNQSQNFTFLRTIDTIQTKATMMFNAFVKLKKNIKRSQNTVLKGYIGIGVSTINTDARNPFYTGQEGESKYEFISTVLVAPGIDYVIKTRHKTKITLAVNYQYSPYKTEGALRQSIGSSAVIPKLLFTF